VASKTLLILASARDDIARQLSVLWEDAGARLLTPRDLSRPGWQYQPGSIQSSIAVADGLPIPASQISAVITRLSSITPDDLIEITPDDRTYVAQEMSAFLVAWLSALPCPVLNRPGTVCLNGPNWRHEQWVHAVAQAGIPVVPTQRHVPFAAASSPPPGPIVTITVVGKTCFGPKDRILRDFALRIARCARVELLDVNFVGEGREARFLSASLWPNIASPDIALAVRDHLSRNARARTRMEPS